VTCDRRGCWSPAGGPPTTLGPGPRAAVGRTLPIGSRARRRQRLQPAGNLLESPASAPPSLAVAPFGRARLAPREMLVRRLLPLLLGGALLGLSHSPALAQNMCSPSTAPTTRYPAYPGSTPYSGNTIQVASNCTGPAVDPGIRPDPFADPDSLPLPTGTGASATSPPSADPATLYAPTGPPSGAPPGAIAAQPGAMGPSGAPGAVGPYAANANTGGAPASAGAYPGYAPSAGMAPPQGAPGQYPGYAANTSAAPGDSGAAAGSAPPGMAAAPGMMPPAYPGMAYPMPGPGYPGQALYPPGPGMPPGYPGMPAGAVPTYP
jgi:hypothetical protein